MKKVLAALGGLLALGALAAVFYLGLHPEEHGALLERIDSLVLGRGEKLEVSPARTPEIAFPLPFTEADTGTYLDMTYGETVFTYFQDLGGDLWLPLRVERPAEPAAVSAVFHGPEGSAEPLDAGACAGDVALGQLRVSGETMAALPEGDYWLAVRCAAGGHDWVQPYYLSVHSRCTFHSPDRGIATGADSDTVLHDRTSGGGFAFHLYNLGDDRVTDVWRLEETLNVNGDGRRNFSRKKLSPDQFTVSPGGATVTLSQDYLDSLFPLQPYYYDFGLGDYASVDATARRGDGVALVVTDGPLADAPAVEGPDTYSLSSGQDYVFTLHPGMARQLYAPGTGLLFHSPEGVPENAYSMSFTLDGLGPDETCVIPAALLREGARRGNADFSVIVTFQLSDLYYQDINHHVLFTD